jgi:Flp pilus assembly protein protease CpaA
MNIGMAGSLIICAWLAVCTAHDLKSRAVPAWLTLPGLFITLLLKETSGELALVAFVALVFVLSDLAPILRGLVCLLLSALFVLALLTSADPVSAELSMLAVLSIWLCWKFNILGGADAQVLATLILLCGPAIIVPVALMNAIQGLAGMILKRKTIPAMLSILAGACVFFAAQALQIS